VRGARAQFPLLRRFSEGSRVIARSSGYARLGRARPRDIAKKSGATRADTAPPSQARLSPSRRFAPPAGFPPARVPVCKTPVRALNHDDNFAGIRRPLRRPDQRAGRATRKNECTRVKSPRAGLPVSSAKTSSAPRNDTLVTTHYDKTAGDPRPRLPPSATLPRLHTTSTTGAASVGIPPGRATARSGTKRRGAPQTTTTEIDGNAPLAAQTGPVVRSRPLAIPSVGGSSSAAAGRSIVRGTAWRGGNGERDMTAQASARPGCRAPVFCSAAKPSAGGRVSIARDFAECFPAAITAGPNGANAVPGGRLLRFERRETARGVDRPPSLNE